QGGRVVGVGVCIAVLFVYYVLMSIAKAMGTVGGLDPFLAAWAPNLCYGLAGVTLWAHEDGWLLQHRIVLPADAHVRSSTCPDRCWGCAPDGARSGDDGGTAEVRR